MKRVAILVASVFICSCIVIGKDTSLEINNSPWQPKKPGMGNEEIYSYGCEGNYYFETNKIIYVENQVYAFGFIIPFIPVIVPFKRYDDNLKIEMAVVGTISPIRSRLENAAFYISSDGSNFVSAKKSVSVKTVEGFSSMELNRATVSVYYPVNEKLPENVYIKTDLEINGCKVPDIAYRMEVKNYTDLTLHMGP